MPMLRAMADDSLDPVVAWRSIVALVNARIAGAADAELDRRRDAKSFTWRETVHHVAEANVVAAGIVIAGLGNPGCTFDWSWMQPFGPWLDRMAYRDRPIAPVLRLLAALNDYVAALVEHLPDGTSRAVLLRDAPGAVPRRSTVGEVLLAAAAPAREHFG